MRGSKAATAACMPRLMRGGGGCHESTARPAASILERIRDVMLRLIMLSAVPRASVQRQRTTSSGKTKASSPRARDSHASVAAVSCRRDDSIRNEAVEDCIEFLKRSSAEGDDATNLSSATTADADALLAKASSMAGANAKLSDKDTELFFVVNVQPRNKASPNA